MPYRCLNCNHVQNAPLICGYCGSPAMREASMRSSPGSALLALAQLDMAVRRLAADGASLESIVQRVKESYTDRARWS